MGKYGKISAVLLLAASLLTGCKKEPVQQPRTVTAVDVQGSIQRHYTQPEKVHNLLNMLRLLEFDGFTSLNPAYLPGDDFVITLEFSDRSTKVYRVHGSRFLCRPNGNWEKVDRNRAGEFPAFFENNASDL